MRAGNVGYDLPDRGPVRQHVRIGGIRERTVAFAGLDAAAQLVSVPRSPAGAEVVVVLTEVSHGLGPDAARPDVLVRRDLGRGDSGHARDHLAALAERPLHQFVVLAPESLGNLGDPGEMLVTHAFKQRVYGDRVLLDRRRNAETDGIELDALLGDLGDVGVGLQLALNVFT